MEKYGLNAAGNLARGALFCGQLCQRLQKAAVIRGGGMAGAAVVSAIFGAEDIKKAAGELKKKVKEIVTGA